MGEKNVGRSKWSSIICRSIGYHDRSAYGRSNRGKHINGTVKRSASGNDKKYHRHFKGLLIDNRGYMSSLEFVILFTLITFLLFGGVDYYLTEMQYSVIEEATNHYLNRMAFVGTLTNADRLSLLEELESKGFINITISPRNWHGEEIGEGDVVVRDIQSPETSLMTLEVSASPQTAPFALGRLLGVQEEGVFYFNVRGRRTSEVPNF